jgi:hypothetical protein
MPAAAGRPADTPIIIVLALTQAGLHPLYTYSDFSFSFSFPSLFCRDRACDLKGSMCIRKAS